MSVVTYKGFKLNTFKKIFFKLKQLHKLIK